MIKEAIAKLIKKENLTTEMMEQVMEEIMTGAVSYTHLDVYKRQLYLRATRLFIG